MLSFTQYQMIIEEIIRIEEGFDLFCLGERKEPVTDFNPVFTQNPSYGETKEQFAERFKAEYDQRLPELEMAKDELERLIKSVAKHDATFVITPFSIKPFKSLLEKIYDRGKKAEHITDVIRCAVLVRTNEEVEDVVKLINRNHHVYEHEYKVMGQDTNFGYFGSHHFLVKLKHGGFLAEIQVMTNRLWSFKTPAHAIYEKYRAGQLDAEFEKAKRESKAIFAKGNISIYKK